jgi:Ca-activated chloride channel family protein
MLRRTAFFLMTALLLATLPVPGPAQEPQRAEDLPTIRRTVDLVNITFTVQTRRQKLVTDLEQKNFRILEDGQPQRILHFSRETDLPLRIGMLLDTSNSIRPRLKFEQEAAIDFLHHVLRRGKDQAFLMIFDNEPYVIHDFTDDLGALTDAILKLRAGGGTALYDAIYHAARNKLMNAPPDRENRELRRILVVISDGDDNLSRRSRLEALEMVQRAEVVVYPISTSTDWVSLSGTTPQKYQKTPGDQVLEFFAEETGGRAFFPYRLDDLSRSFLDIGNELRSQYSLAYTPTNRKLDGKFRSIKIETDRGGMVIRSRKGYFAPATSADSGSRESRPGSPPAQP